MALPGKEERTRQHRVRPWSPIMPLPRLLRTSIALAACCAAAALLLPAQRRQATSWEFTPDPKLPNVLIVGDSISMGYTPIVRTLLAGKANVFHPMRPGGKVPANCFSTAIGLTDLDKWLGDTKWAVIQFNWGLHDLCYRNPEAKTQGNRDKEHGKIEVPLTDYQANLEKLVATLEKTGAHLIWASTTKVPDGDIGRVAGDDLKYNAAAKAVMVRHRIAIDCQLSARALARSGQRTLQAGRL